MINASALILITLVFSLLTLRSACLMHVHVGLNKKSLKILYSMQVTYIHVLLTHSEALISHKTIIDIKIDIYLATSDRIK